MQACGPRNRHSESISPLGSLLEEMGAAWKEVQASAGWLYTYGFPLWIMGKESTYNVETWIQSVGWENTLKKGKATTV